MSDVVERYLTLGLRLGRHVDGLVDAYYGPPELAAEVEAEDPVEPAELARGRPTPSRRTSRAPTSSTSSAGAGSATR